MCDSLYQAIATVTGCRVGSGPLGFRLEPLVRGQAVQQTRETLGNFPWCGLAGPHLAIPAMTLLAATGGGAAFSGVHLNR